MLDDMNKEDFSEIIDWDNFFKHSEQFKSQKPFNFVFIENFFKRDFYECLYNSYPKIDDSWFYGSTIYKSQYAKYWNDTEPAVPVDYEDDPQYSDEWNKLKRYAHSDEFINNFAKFSGIDVNKLKYFHFMGYKQGGFQQCHMHNVGPKTLIIMIYLSKNWKEGEPGGTYMADGDDEDSIIFEPSNLDNSLAMFHDGPKAFHGVRYITKNNERKALQITLEYYSPASGWSGGSAEGNKGLS